MPEEFIIRHCAPTLAGIKVGNLFSYPACCMQDTIRALAHWNNQLRHKGVRFVLLGCRNSRVLILAYRESFLAKALADSENCLYLSRLGYPCNHVAQSLSILRGRVEAAKEFPHEIGIFLGYPLADVKAFIENKGCNSVCCGCWKAYTDGDAAAETFQKFQKCVKIYRRCHANGADLNRLTVTA
jgi:hypothetical protein